MWKRESKVADVLVVIRSERERTLPLCKALLEKQVPASNIVVIEEKPFNAALKKGFEIGIDYGLKWTLCVDADVLILDDAVQKIVHLMHRSPSNAFAVTGLMLDKFDGSKRIGGPHLYRTELLKAAVAKVPEPHVDIRPETYVKHQMRSAGFPLIEPKVLLALHDFEQYYTDVFRKLVVRCVKHKKRMPLFFKQAARHRRDLDFLIGMWGVRYSLACQISEVVLHSELWREQANLLMSCHGLAEKAALSEEECKSKSVKSLRRGSGLSNLAGLSAATEVSNMDRIVWQTGQMLSNVGTYLQQRRLAV